MTYTLQEQYTSKNMVAGGSADNVWHLGPRRVTSITIHHWGEKGQQFDTVRDFLCTNNTPTSAHYVAQDGLVACIVSPDDCAFHAGNAEGNTFSVGIECRPEATDGDYNTIAELIRYLRGIYGDIPLYPHNHWYNTACPGDYDLARLDTLARGGTISVQSTTTPTTTTQETFMGGTIDPQQAEDIVQSTTDRVVARLTAALFSKSDGAWQNGLLANLPAQILNQAFTLPDGTNTNLAGILAQINAKPAAVTNVTSAPAAVDVDAIVARLKTELPAAQFEYFKTQINK
jgi:hypothetical protein